MTTDLAVFCHISLRDMRGSCSNKFRNIWSYFYRNVSVNSERIHCPAISFIDVGEMEIHHYNKKVTGALLTDLTKTFDCLSHHLIIAILNWYAISIATLRLVQNYFSNRKQRSKINSDFSSWEDILFGVKHLKL